MACGVLDVPVLIDLRNALEGNALTQCIQMGTKGLNFLYEFSVAISSREFLRAIGEAPKSGRQAAATQQLSLENVERAVGLHATCRDSVDFVDCFLCRHRMGDSEDRLKSEQRQGPRLIAL